MNSYIMLIVVLFPIIASTLIPLFKNKSKKSMQIFVFTTVLINSILVFFMLGSDLTEQFTIMQFTGDLSIVFKMDGLTKVFAGLVSFLWPFATLYAFEYMHHDKNQTIFFMFYTMTYGITLGISLASNIITLYFFYELLTLVTLPLVMHTLTKEAIYASRSYLYYSLGGAAFAFIGVVFIIIFGGGDFVFGGNVNATNQSLELIVYLLTFLGFGVKAAIFPFNAWLPKAGVAPTPVTALLHAVAVVKAGAFAIMRLTFYCFKTEDIKGTWAQNVLMIIIIFTIVYGCSRALKETHFKRRLAYSTISNLSYILFGVILMTPLGFVGALAHMIVHAFVKITSFFCAGAVIHTTEKEYIHQLNGLGRKMPITFAVFTVSALALMGVPGLAGFISKWYLAFAATATQTPLAYVGIGAILISALLTAIYMITIVIRAFFEKDEANAFENAKDPTYKMLLPLCVFTVVIVYLGINSNSLINFFESVAHLN